MASAHDPVPVDILDPALAALVLAGGQSSRMGQDKALLPVSPQQVLLQQICHVALTCTPVVSVITPWPQRYRDHLPDAVSLIREHPLADADRPSQGPLVAVAAGMAAIKASWVLVLACDLPNLTAAPLQAWLTQIRREPAPPQTPPIWLPRQTGRWEPLCGFYHITCLPRLQQYVADGGRSFQRWLQTQWVGQLPLPNPALLINTNTPKDWQRWRQQGMKTETSGE